LAICDFIQDKRPVWVQANASTVLNHKLEDVAFITLGYPDNVIANIHVSWVDPNKVREVVAVGSQRRIVFDDLNTMERVRIYEKGIAASPNQSSNQEADTFGEFRLLVRDGDIISPRVAPSEPLRNQVEHFLCCVASGCSPVSDSAVAVANVRALVAIDRSLAQNGARVEV
jgi:predicted dehydrogenase